jgi:hypothetical protein
MALLIVAKEEPDASVALTVMFDELGIPPGKPMLPVHPGFLLDGITDAPAVRVAITINPKQGSLRSKRTGKMNLIAA